MKLYFQNFGIHCILKRKIQKILDCAINENQIKYKDNSFSINIAFLSENQIKDLNNKFRKQNKETDVLSFPAFNLKKGEHFDLKKIAKEINFDDGLICLGDIAICKAIAKKQAKTYGHSLKNEICFLALHGFLHLLGYDHLTDDEENEMNLLTKKILKNFNI
ncbi:MAG: rRNA maturation RNase YbeY [Clostridia bacterium]|nr:rRNA maturation RNase YbeY [Clostridia bacterium]MDD3862783.1 rRNA maturation RNase YbeY [Clostridia bacterium]MDD4408501.1 rRNA maturation RNase YbeY [Clostridia bacterium]